MGTVLSNLNRLIDDKFGGIVDESSDDNADFQEDINIAMGYPEQVDYPSEILSFFNDDYDI